MPFIDANWTAAASQQRMLPLMTLFLPRGSGRRISRLDWVESDGKLEVRMR
jgi:hypothetical protein